MAKKELAINFANNLEIERMNLDISQAEMADRLGLSLSTYKRIINNETSKIDIYTAYRLYEFTRKSFLEYANDQDEYINISKKIHNLSKSQLNVLNSFVDFQLSCQDCKSDSEKFIPLFIPTGNMEDGMILDSAHYQKFDVSCYKNKYGTEIDCGIKITSNHLHPVYHLNDILLLSCTPIRDGDTGIFINKENGCAYIRKFHQNSPATLEPVNNLGKTFHVDIHNEKDMSKWIKFGHVISKIH